MLFSYRFDREFPCTVTFPNGRHTLSGVYEGRAPYDVAVNAVIDCLRQQRPAALQAIAASQKAFVVEVEDGYTNSRYTSSGRRRRAFPGSARQEVCLRLDERTGSLIYANITRGSEALALVEAYFQLDSDEPAPSL